MNFIKRILAGIIIGGGMVLPGVSGGVLAVILGIYESLLDSISNFLKDAKKHSLFLGPIIMGVVIGVFLFGKVLFFVFDNHPMEAKYTFIGLILGGIPALFKEVKTKGNRKLNIPIFVITFIISIALFVLGKGSLDIDFASKINSGPIAFILLFATGFIFIAGKIIPGISSSFMLMLIGMYQFLLNILNNPLRLTHNEYLQIIPFVLGIVIGAVCLVKLIQSLIKHHFSITYSAIIGFVIGSISAIYPGFSFDLKGIMCLALAIISFVVIYKFTLTTQKEPKHCQRY